MIATFVEQHDRAPGPRPGSAPTSPTGAAIARFPLPTEEGIEILAAVDGLRSRYAEHGAAKAVRRHGDPKREILAAALEFERGS